MKVLELTALDGSKWHIPLTVITNAHVRQVEALADFSEEQAGARSWVDRVQSSIVSAAAAWAKSDMSWSDVKAHATKVKDADPLNMDDSWTNGQMKVIEVAPPRPASEGTPGVLTAASSTFLPSIVFNGPDNKAHVTVRPTGEVEIAEGVTLTEAARLFWAAVDKMGISRVAQSRAFKVGDVVKNENGPAMTVEHVDGSRIYCVWFVGKKLNSGTFDAENLKHFCGGCARLEWQLSMLTNPEYMAARLSHNELVAVYNRMDGAAIIAKVEVGSHGDAILAAYGRAAIRAAVERVASEV